MLNGVLKGGGDRGTNFIFKPNFPNIPVSPFNFASSLICNGKDACVA